MPSGVCAAAIRLATSATGAAVEVLVVALATGAAAEELAVVLATGVALVLAVVAGAEEWR